MSAFMCPVHRHGLDSFVLAFQHREHTVPANEPGRFGSPGKLSAYRALVADGVTFAGGSRDSGSAVGSGVSSSDTDAGRFVAVQLDFLDIIFKNPFQKAVGGFRMAPAVFGSATG